MGTGNNYGRDIYGADGEAYLRELFQFVNIPTGHRYPDLLSPKEFSDPALALEVKTGKSRSPPLCEYQLHYGFNPHIPKGLRSRLNSMPRTYFAFPDRTNDAPNELYPAYKQVAVTWGDVYIVPAEFAFTTFVVSKALRTGADPEVVKTELEALRKKQIDGTLNGDKYQKHLQSWQAIRFNDLDALRTNQIEQASKHIITRTTLLRQLYPAYEQLEHITLNGPNRTNLYVFAKPEDAPLFERNLRDITGQQTPRLERIAQERTNGVHLLEHTTMPQIDLFETPTEKPTLTHDEKRYLQQLADWKLPSDDLLARIHKR